jgi:hypothetical protein
VAAPIAIRGSQTKGKDKVSGLRGRLIISELFHSVSGRGREQGPQKLKLIGFY